MKIVKNVAVFIFVIATILSINILTIKDVSFATDEAEYTLKIQQKIEKELSSFLEVGVKPSERTRKARIPGSEAEYNSAMYIKNELKTLTNYKPVNNQSTVDGVESFDFTCVYDGNIYTSQNIIFKRESLIETDRKVVIAAHYDSTFIFNTEIEKYAYSSENSLVIEGVNDNGASVATLLALVKSLDEEPLDYGYDIEIVFFGASSNNYAGSEFYSRGQSEEDAKNTLLMINLDRIALGDYNYFYMGEFETNQSKYVSDRLYGFKELKQQNTIDFNLNGPNDLSYTHLGLESDHQSFIDRNVNTLFFFSGNYESSLTYGLKEYEGENIVTFTENDTYSYTTNHCDNFYTNLSNVYKAINSLISHDKFISVMERDNGLEAKFDFWTNEKLAVFMTSVLLVIFVFIYLAIHKNLQDKSKQALENSDIDKIVFQITSNLPDVDNQELNDAIDKKVKHDASDENDEN